MSNTLPIREGWTERIRYRLTRNDPPENVDLTGLTVDLVAYDNGNSLLTFSGTVGSDDPSNGVVYFDPSVSDLESGNSPYRVRWKITDSAGKIAYFPREDPLLWEIELP